MRYYLAGPIDFMDERSWKKQLKDMCKVNDGVILFDPDTYSFGKITPEVSKYIHDVNMHAIRESDAIVANWVSTFKGVGTLMELYYSVMIKKPIILITDMMGMSVYMNYIGQNSREVISNVNEAYGSILKFENNHKGLLRNKKLDSLNMLQGMARDL